MVEKILKFFYKETSTLNQAAFVLGLFSLISQAVGLLRDRLLAHVFGAGATLDIYYAAFRIPDFLFVTVASVVSISVLIPFIIEKDGEDRQYLRDFINNIFSFFGILMVLIALVTYFVMPQISALLFKGLSPEALGQVIKISRWLLLSPIILGLSNLFGSLTQAYNRFMVYAVAPILYNTGIVLGIIFLSPQWGVSGVVIGVLVGALMHLLVQIPFVWKLGLLPKPVLRLDWAMIKKVASTSLPRTLSLSMSSFVFLFLVAMASRQEAGSVSVINFSNNLQTISLSLIGVSYSLAAFPTLTRHFKDKNLSSFLGQMQTTSRLIIFWSLPFTALLVVLRAQVVRVLLGSGEFDWTATRLTAAALALFVISSVFQSLLLLFMRGFYSAGFTKKPFFINLFSTIGMVAITYGLLNWFYTSPTFSAFIVKLLKVDSLNGSAVLMLPLGFTLGTILNGVWLWWAFEREFPGYSRGVVRSLGEGTFSAVVMGVVAYAGLAIFSKIFVLDSLINVFLQGFLAGVMGIIAGMVTLALFKSPELKSIISTARSKFWKTRVIATDPEIV